MTIKSTNPNYFKRKKRLVAFSNNIVNVRCDVESFSEWDSQESEGKSSLERWMKTEGCYFIIIIMYN